MYTVHMYVCMYLCMYVCVSMCVCVCMYVCMYVHGYMYVCMCMGICVCVCVCFGMHVPTYLSHIDVQTFTDVSTSMKRGNTDCTPQSVHKKLCLILNVMMMSVMRQPC